jgi:CDP-ribitol ribitolphosphotransferase
MYGMLRFSSGLITDYSSVIFDYIITGKPIGIDLEACSTYTREKYFDYDFSQLHSVPISNINELINFCQYVISAESNRLCQSDSKYVTYTKTTFSESVYNEQMSYIND